MIPKEIWQIVYSSFEDNPAAGLRTMSATNGTKNEIQFRLQKTIAELTTEPDKTNDVIADVLLANSLGYITDESTNKIVEMLEENYGTRSN